MRLFVFILPLTEETGDSLVVHLSPASPGNRGVRTPAPGP